MSCRTFELAWRHHLDGETSLPPSALPEWSRHLNFCARCRGRDARWRILAAAMTAWSDPAAIAARAEDAPVPASRPRRRLVVRPTWVAAGVAAAACVLGIARLPASLPRQNATSAAAGTAAEPDLAGSLAEATSASFDLARRTSEPAAWVGRALIADSTREGPWVVRVALVEPAVAAPEAIRGLGRRVLTGMQPISDQTREAFGFLLPRDVPDEARASTGRGA